MNDGEQVEYGSVKDLINARLELTDTFNKSVNKGEAV